MSHIVEQSNLYSVQSDLTKPLGLTSKELAKFLAIILKMSIFCLPRSQQYWSKAYSIEHVNSIMGRVRFEQIKKNIHFNDNNEMVPSTDENFDKLFKVRPLLSHLQNKFKAIPMDQKVCVDEQMVPFKGRSGLKQ